MEIIVVPLIVWIGVSGLYGFFELYARRGERKALIEKMGDKLDSSLLGGNFSLMQFPLKSFSSLKTGCLLAGLGLGLLVGLLINTMLHSSNFFAGMERWSIENFIGVAYGASVLLFGGIGLLISFLIENKMNKRNF